MTPTWKPKAIETVRNGAQSGATSGSASGAVSGSASGAASGSASGAASGSTSGAAITSALGAPGPSTIGEQMRQTSTPIAIETVRNNVQVSPASGAPSCSTSGAQIPSPLGEQRPSTIGASITQTWTQNAIETVSDDVQMSTESDESSGSTSGTEIPSALGVPRPSTIGALMAPTWTSTWTPTWTPNAIKTVRNDVQMSSESDESNGSIHEVEIPSALHTQGLSTIGSPMTQTTTPTAIETVRNNVQISPTSGEPSGSTYGASISSALGVPRPSTIGEPMTPTSTPNVIETVSDDVQMSSESDESSDSVSEVEIPSALGVLRPSTIDAPMTPTWTPLWTQNAMETVRNIVQMSSESDESIGSISEVEIPSALGAPRPSTIGAPMAQTSTPNTIETVSDDAQMSAESDESSGSISEGEITSALGAPRSSTIGAPMTQTSTLNAIETVSDDAQMSSESDESSGSISEVEIPSALGAPRSSTIGAPMTPTSTLNAIETVSDDAQMSAESDESSGSISEVEIPSALDALTPSTIGAPMTQTSTPNAIETVSEDLQMSSESDESSGSISEVEIPSALGTPRPSTSAEPSRILTPRKSVHGIRSHAFSGFPIQPVATNPDFLVALNRIPSENLPEPYGTKIQRSTSGALMSSELGTPRPSTIGSPMTPTSTPKAIETVRNDVQISKSGSISEVEIPSALGAPKPSTSAEPSRILTPRKSVYGIQSHAMSGLPIQPVATNPDCVVALNRIPSENLPEPYGTKIESSTSSALMSSELGSPRPSTIGAPMTPTSTPNAIETVRNIVQVSSESDESIGSISEVEIPSALHEPRPSTIDTPMTQTSTPNVIETVSDDVQMSSESDESSVSISEVEIPSAPKPSTSAEPSRILTPRKSVYGIQSHAFSGMPIQPVAINPDCVVALNRIPSENLPEPYGTKIQRSTSGALMSSELGSPRPSTIGAPMTPTSTPNAIETVRNIVQVSSESDELSVSISEVEIPSALHEPRPSTIDAPMTPTSTPNVIETVSDDVQMSSESDELSVSISEVEIPSALGAPKPSTSADPSRILTPIKSVYGIQSHAFSGLPIQPVATNPDCVVALNRIPSENLPEPYGTKIQRSTSGALMSSELGSPRPSTIDAPITPTSTPNAIETVRNIVQVSSESDESIGSIFEVEIPSALHEPRPSTIDAPMTPTSTPNVIETVSDDVQMSSESDELSVSISEVEIPSALGAPKPSTSADPSRILTPIKSVYGIQSHAFSGLPIQPVATNPDCVVALNRIPSENLPEPYGTKIQRSTSGALMSSELGSPRPSTIGAPMTPTSTPNAIETVRNIVQVSSIGSISEVEIPSASHEPRPSTIDTPMTQTSTPNVIETVSDDVQMSSESDELSVSISEVEIPSALGAPKPSTSAEPSRILTPRKSVYGIQSHAMSGLPIQPVATNPDCIVALNRIPSENLPEPYGTKIQRSTSGAQMSSELGSPRPSSIGAPMTPTSTPNAIETVRNIVQVSSIGSISEVEIPSALHEPRPSTIDAPITPTSTPNAIETVRNIVQVSSESDELSVSISEVEIPSALHEPRPSTIDAPMKPTSTPNVIETVSDDVQMSTKSDELSVSISEVEIPSALGAPKPSTSAEPSRILTPRKSVYGIQSHAMSGLPIHPVATNPDCVVALNRIPSENLPEPYGTKIQRSTSGALMSSEFGSPRPSTIGAPMTPTSTPNAIETVRNIVQVSSIGSISEVEIPSALHEPRPSTIDAPITPTSTPNVIETVSNDVQISPTSGEPSGSTFGASISSALVATRPSTIGAPMTPTSTPNVVETVSDDVQMSSEFDETCDSASEVEIPSALGAPIIRRDILNILDFEESYDYTSGALIPSPLGEPRTSTNDASIMQTWTQNAIESVSDDVQMLSESDELGISSLEFEIASALGISNPTTSADLSRLLTPRESVYDIQSHEFSDFPIQPEITIPDFLLALNRITSLNLSEPYGTKIQSGDRLKSPILRWSTIPGTLIPATSGARMRLYNRAREASKFATSITSIYGGRRQLSARIRRLTKYDPSISATSGCRKRSYSHTSRSTIVDASIPSATNAARQLILDAQGTRTRSKGLLVLEPIPSKRSKIDKRRQTTWERQRPTTSDARGQAINTRRMTTHDTRRPKQKSEDCFYYVKPVTRSATRAARQQPPSDARNQLLPAANTIPPIADEKLQMECINRLNINAPKPLTINSLLPVIPLKCYMSNAATTNAGVPISYVSATKIWRKVDAERMLLYKPENLQPSAKIACYNLVGGLIKQINERDRAGNIIKNWKLIYPMETKIKFRHLFRNGYKIVILAHPPNLMNRIPFFQEKMNNLIDEIGVPIQFFVCISKEPQYTLPMYGMWSFFEKYTNGGYEIDRVLSFYVGSAAGRVENAERNIKKEASCADRLMAINVNIPFHTPEEHFLDYPKQAFNLPNFNPRFVECIYNVGFSRNFAKECIFSSSQVVLQSGTMEVNLIVGVPASGKTYFGQRYLSWSYYDVIGICTNSPPSCLIEMMKKFAKSLKRRKSCVIISPMTGIKRVREIFIKMARKYKTNIRCLRMTTSLAQCRHNIRYRNLMHNELTVNNAIEKFMETFTEPDFEEGFDNIVGVNFQPNFSFLDDVIVYRTYLYDI